MECVRRHRCWLLRLLLLVPLLWEVRPALAQEGAGTLILMPARSALTRGQTRASALAFDCVDDRVVFETTVHQRRVTTFNLPSPVLDVVSSDPRGLQLEWEGSRVTLQPRRARGDVPATIRIETTTCEAHVILRQAERLEDTPAIVEIQQRDEVMEMLTDVQTGVHALQKGALRPQEDQERATAQQKTILEGLAVRTDLVPGKTSTEGGPMRLIIERGLWMQDDFYVSFQMDNPTTERLRVSQPYAVDAHGARTDITEISINAPVTRENDGTWAIPPGARTHGILKVPNARDRKIQPLRIVMSEASTLQTSVATIQDWEIWIPRTPEQVEEAERQKREAKEKAEIQKREAKEKERVTLHVLGVAGGIWLQESQTEGRLDATSMTGLGARVTYAYNRHLAVEGEALGASTGNARFANASFDGMQGELLRSATLGRVQAGGVLRLGRQIIPLLRVGLGAQVSSIDSRFVIDGSEAPGPGHAYDFDPLWYLGAGMELRPTEHLVAGFTLTTEKMASSASRTLEAGIHIGYGWKP